MIDCAFEVTKSRTERGKNKDEPITCVKRGFGGGNFVGVFSHGCNNHTEDFIEQNDPRMSG